MRTHAYTSLCVLYEGVLCMWGVREQKLLERQEKEYHQEKASLQDLLQQQGESQNHYAELLQEAEDEKVSLLQRVDQLRQKHEQMEQHVSQVLQQLVDVKEERERAVRELKNLRRKLGGEDGGGEEEEDPLKQQLLTLQQEVGKRNTSVAHDGPSPAFLSGVHTPRK